MGIANRWSRGCPCASKGVRWWGDILRGRARVTARTLTAAVPELKKPAGQDGPLAAPRSLVLLAASVESSPSVSSRLAPRTTQQRKRQSETHRYDVSHPGRAA